MLSLAPEPVFNLEMLAEFDLIDAELAAELDAPRHFNETAADYAARRAAADDIAADLLAETGTGPDDDAAVLAFPAPAPAAAPLAS